MINSEQVKPKIIDLQIVLNTLKKQKNFRNQFGIKTLALFGSTACNQATENSDLDFLVEFQDSITFDNYMALKLYLAGLFHKPVDLVIKADLKPIIREKIYLVILPYI